MAFDGDKVRAEIIAASKFAVDEIVSACVQTAKSNHPGWNNVTGTAEGSIRVQEFAREDGSGVRALWGSVDVDYMVFLELNSGSALRSAADLLYPRLAERIRAALNT